MVDRMIFAYLDNQEVDQLGQKFRPDKLLCHLPC